MTLREVVAALQDQLAAAVKSAEEQRARGNSLSTKLASYACSECAGVGKISVDEVVDFQAFTPDAIALYGEGLHKRELTITSRCEPCGGTGLLQRDDIDSWRAEVGQRARADKLEEELARTVRRLAEAEVERDEHPEHGLKEGFER